MLPQRAPPPTLPEAALLASPCGALPRARWSGTLRPAKRIARSSTGRLGHRGQACRSRDLRRGRHAAGRRGDSLRRCRGAQGSCAARPTVHLRGDCLHCLRTPAAPSPPRRRRPCMQLGLRTQTAAQYGVHDIARAFCTERPGEAPGVMQNVLASTSSAASMARCTPCKRSGAHIIATSRALGRQGTPPEARIAHPRLKVRRRAGDYAQRLLHAVPAPSAVVTHPDFKCTRGRASARQSTRRRYVSGHIVPGTLVLTPQGQALEGTGRGVGFDSQHPPALVVTMQASAARRSSHATWRQRQTGIGAQTPASRCCITLARRRRPSMQRQACLRARGTAREYRTERCQTRHNVP